MLTEGMEWIDVEDGDNNVTQIAKASKISGTLSSASAPAPAVSYAQMASLGHVKTVNPPRSGFETSANMQSAPSLFGSHALEHKAEVQPIFLTYSQVLSEGDHIPLVQVASAVVCAIG